MLLEGVQVASRRAYWISTSKSGTGLHIAKTFLSHTPFAFEAASARNFEARGSMTGYDFAAVGPRRPDPLANIERHVEVAAGIALGLETLQTCNLSCPSVVNVTVLPKVSRPQCAKARPLFHPQQ